jgi:hypothetical protein
VTQAGTVAIQPDANRHEDRPVVEHLRGERSGWMTPAFIIVAELTLIAWLIRNSYYAADDWIMFSIAKSSGLTWRTLSFNLYNHFAPIEWLLHVLVQDVAPLNYRAGMAIILALCAGMLLALWWTLHVLEAPRAVVLGGIVLIGTSPFLVNSALWFGQAVFIPLFVTGMVLVIGFFVRWCRYGRRGDAIGAWTIFTASLLVGEIPLLLLPLLVLLRYWVVDRPGWRKLSGAIWRDRWVWVPFAAVGVAFTWFFHTHYYGAQPKPSLGQFFGAFTYGSVRLWRGTIGTPIVSGHIWVRVLSDLGVVVTGIGVVFLCFRSRTAARAVAFFAVYFVLKQAALGLGIVGKYGANAVTSDSQYYIDLLVMAVLAVALATSRGWIGAPNAPAVGLPVDASASTSSAMGRHGVRGKHRRARRAPIGVVAGVLVVLGAHALATPFGLSNLVRGNFAALDSRSYVQRLRSGLETVDRSQQHATIVPMLLPGYVAPGFIAPYNRQDVFLKLAPEWRAFDWGPVMAIADSGNLIPVEASRSTQIELASPTIAVAELTRRPSPNAEACFDGQARPGTIALPLPAPVEGAPLVVDLRVQSAKALHFTLATKTNASWTYSPLSIGGGRGYQRFVTWLPGNAASSVALASISPFSSFCVLGVQVGVMITTADQSGNCHSLANNGASGSATPCGRPWE